LAAEYRITVPEIFGKSHQAKLEDLPSREAACAARASGKQAMMPRHRTPRSARGGVSSLSTPRPERRLDVDPRCGSQDIHGSCAAVRPLSRAMSRRSQKRQGCSDIVLDDPHVLQVPESPSMPSSPRRAYENDAMFWRVSELVAGTKTSGLIYSTRVPRRGGGAFTSPDRRLAVLSGAGVRDRSVARRKG